MKKQFWILIYIILYPFALVAQIQLDSLKDLVNKASDDEKIELLIQMAWEQRSDFPDSSLIYLEEAHGLAHKTKHPEFLPKIINFQGVAYRYAGDYFKSLEKFKQALNEAQVMTDTLQIAHSYHNLGSIRQTQSNYEAAYRNFSKALTLFGNLKDTIGMGYCYQSFAIAYHSQGKHQKAIEMAEMSLELRKTTYDKRTISSALIELAHIYQKMGAYSRALEVLFEAKNYALTLDEKTRSGEVSLEIAETYYLRGDYGQALNNARIANNILQRVSNEIMTIRANLLLGKIYYKIRKHNMAEPYLKYVLGPQNKTGQLSLKSDALFHLSRIKERQGKHKDALSYFKKFNAVEDSILNIDKSKEIGRLETRFELMQKEQENTHLKEQEKVNQNIIQKHQERNIALVIVVILGTGLIGLLIWKNRQTNSLFSQLKEQKEKTEQQYAEVKRNKEQLEDINKEKDGLMGIVAHDLKAPLNRIKGYMQIIKLTGSFTEEQDQYLQGIEQSAENGRNLIRDLLDVSAYEGDNLSLHIEDFSLNDLATRTVNTYAMEAQKKGIKVNQQFEQDLHIVSDYALLSRIIENLFSNAIKFSPNDKQVYVRLWSEQNKAMISIKDEGPGFNEEDKKKMFKKFQRLTAQPTGGENSTGLGLAIVKTLLERLSGKIELVSETGKGAEFVLSFPMSISNIPKLKPKHSQP